MFGDHLPAVEEEFLNATLPENDIFALLLALHTLLPPSQFHELNSEFMLLFWDFLDKNPDIDAYKFLKMMGIPSPYYQKNMRPGSSY